MSKGTNRVFLPWVLLTGALTLLAGGHGVAGSPIYRTVDADGNVIFSDVPPAPGRYTESLELSTPNTFSSPVTAGTGPVPAGTGPAPAGDAVRLEVWLADGEGARDPDAAARGYQLLRITAPPDDAGLRDNAGNVTVLGELHPALLPGHAVQLYLDGALQQSAAQPQFQLLNVDRGTHTLQLRVVDASGTVLISSAPSVFHLQRRSLILQPAPGKP
jgi:hypothetical protein